MNKLPPLNRDYNRHPNIKTLQRKGFVNQGPTLSVNFQVEASRERLPEECQISELIKLGILRDAKNYM